MAPMPPTIRPSSRITKPLLGLPGHQFCVNALAHSSAERSRLRFSHRNLQNSGRSSSRIGSRVGRLIAMSETLEYLQGRFLQSGPEDALNKLPVRPELVQRGPEDALNKLAVRPELVEACPERSRRG